MKKTFKKFIKVIIPEERKVKQDTKKYYCELIQLGYTHDEAIKEIKEIFKWMMEEVAHIEGKTL